MSLRLLLAIEIATQTCSLSQDSFCYNYRRLKSSASYASHENILLRCGKILKCRRHLRRHRLIRLGGRLSVARVYL